MPELIVRILGDTSSLERSYKRAAVGTTRFSKEIERAGRGALSGTLAFKGLGRSIAFASGGFLAFEGASRFLEESVSVAREAAVGQRALAAQMKASGESFAASRDQIEKAGLSMSKFGFTSEDADRALGVLERGTGSIRKSIGLLGLTADLARAKNLDFAAAANIVAKVFGGQTTALRRAVPGLEKNAKGWDLIREAQAKLAGQAAAGTTVSDRFAATLHETQRIIGEGLLPVLNKYLGQLTVWLDKMNKSGQLQKDLNSFVKESTPIFHGAGVAIGIAADALHRYGDMLGALRTESKKGGLLNLPGRGAADVLRLLVDPGYGISKVIQTLRGPGGRGGGASASGLDPLRGPVGTPTTAAAPPGLTGPVTPPTTRPATVTQRNTWFDQMIQRDITRAGYIPTLKQQVARYKQIVELIQQRVAATKDVTRKLNLEDQALSVQQQISQAQAQIADNAKAAAQAAAAKKQELQQALFDRLQFNVDKAGLTQSLQDDLAALRRYLAVVKEMIRTRGSTLALQQQLLAIELNIKDVQGQIADSRKAAAEAAKAAIDKANQAKVDAANVAVAKTGLTDTLSDDLAANMKLLAVLKKTHASAIDIVNQQLAIKSIQDQIAQNAKDAADKAKKDSLPLFRHLSATAFVDQYGLGLTTRQKHRLEVGLGMMGPGGTMPPGASAQFTSGTSINIEHFHSSAPDVPALENEIVKRAKARPNVRRGARG